MVGFLRMAKNNELMESIISLAKRRGFIYQGSDIYGGLAGTWDYGHLGLLLKNNIKNLWQKRFIQSRDDMYGIDTALLMNPKVWMASGHVGGFADPLVEDTKTKKRFRADHLLEEAGVNVSGMTLADMNGKIKELFNMMFKTHIGATEDEASVSYLRPETAQGMFVNFKNTLDSYHPKLPFGIAQIGKAFRNEIAPRDFIFRTREFEQMEIEYFVHEKDWETQFEYWRGEMWGWMESIGLTKEKIHELEVAPEDRAHYSKRTIDFEFDFPFGKKELYGLAYRTDFDLKNHMEASGQDLRYLDEETKERFVPHVIEPTFGVDRTLLAVLASAYTEDEMNKEKRSYLKLSPALAPYKIAVFPLLKNKPELVKRAYHIYSELKKKYGYVMFDEGGNIGKRYRKQDEIGTPFCVTIDFDTLEDGTVTVRDRDTGGQKRIKEEEIFSILDN